MAEAQQGVRAAALSASEAEDEGAGKKRWGIFGGKKKKGKKGAPEPPPRALIYIHHDPAKAWPPEEGEEMEGREFTVLLESLTFRDTRLARALAAASDVRRNPPCRSETILMLTCVRAVSGCGRVPRAEGSGANREGDAGC